MILSLAVILLYISLVHGFGCYTCSSPDTHLEAPQLLHLRSQTDIFFYSDRYSPSCNRNLSAAVTGDVEVSVCDDIDRCATLSPAFDLAHNETVVHRGCFGSLLRHKFKDRKFVHQEGCYLLRSIPLYDVEYPVDYVLCVCSENYCNSDVPRFGSDLFSGASKSLRKLHAEKKMSLLHRNPSTGLLQLDFPLTNLSIHRSLLSVVYILWRFIVQSL